MAEGCQHFPTPHAAGILQKERESGYGGDRQRQRGHLFEDVDQMDSLKVRRESGGKVLKGGSSQRFIIIIISPFPQDCK